VQSIDVSSPVLWTGQTVNNGTVTLNVPTGQTELNVMLSASVAGVTFLPNPVPIAANGATTGNFKITVPDTETPGTVTITASLLMAPHPPQPRFRRVRFSWTCKGLSLLMESRWSPVNLWYARFT